MENKVRHLEMIANTVARMGQNSFQIRGWAVVVVSAILGLAGDLNRSVNPMLAIAPIAAFWLLDAYYLVLERRFRALFDEVSNKKEEDINFQMNPALVVTKLPKYFTAAFSSTMFLTYGGLALVVFASKYFLG